MNRPFEDYLSVQVDEHGKTFIHLGKEELEVIAKAVCDEMDRREYESKMKVISS